MQIASFLPSRPTWLVQPTLAAVAMCAVLALAPAPGRAAESKPRLADVSRQTADVADRYFKAYVDRRWDDLEPLVADSASFRDPTATLVFGSTEMRGKPAMMKAFRQNYAVLTSMTFAPSRRLISGEWALFEGDLSWTLRLRDGQFVSSVTPIVVTLHVQDGLVVDHTDMVDYQPFVDQLAKMRPVGEP